MPQINRTIIVERDSRDLTARVIEALDGYDAVAQSAADAAGAAADAATAAGSATTAANAAQTAATDALQATKLTYLDVQWGSLTGTLPSVNIHMGMYTVHEQLEEGGCIVWMQCKFLCV